jgi:hypothetical protein
MSNTGWKITYVNSKLAISDSRDYISWTIGFHP